ncbi:MAG: phosphosulfolactate synthase [Bacillota bacterium]
MQEAGGFSGVVTHPIPGREGKPRERGLTMVIDKGSSVSETRQLVELAGDYIDLFKLAFGTSLLYSETMLKAKIELLVANQIEVYPGGTLLEIAFYQGRIREFLNRCLRLGFTAIEVSEGTLDMTPVTRREIVRMAVDLGFRVLTEVGKKDSRLRLSNARLEEQIASDLADGAYKVIIEGRDSGRGVGIYDQAGNIIDQELERVLHAARGIDHIIWEAPMGSQQKDLLRRFGPRVNLGNVQVNEVIALEAMRCGLRSDTFATVLEASTAAVVEEGTS